MHSATSLDRPPGPSALDIRAAYPDDSYVAFHAPRYALLLDLLAPIVRPDWSVLDIGKSTLSELMAKRFGVAVDTLGFHPEGPGATGRHFHYDLNLTRSVDGWRRDLPKYDLIVMAEVIEHLPVAPSMVLAFLTELLQPAGRLVIQTPNAAALHKRIKLLLGRNPYELIREDLTDPGHFREYTPREIERYAAAAGFVVEKLVIGSYFDYRFSRHGAGVAPTADPTRALVNLVYRIVPGTLRPGMTFLLRRSSSSAG